LGVYEEVLSGEKDDPYISKFFFNQGILHCEMGMEEESVALFFQVRGNAEDGLLIEQLELLL